MYSTETIPQMNVSREADDAFMAELKRTDRARYDRLVKAMQVHALQLQRLPEVAETPVRRCKHCGLVLPNELRADAKFCDGTCKRNAAFARTAEKPLLPVANLNLSVENTSIGAAF